MSHQSNVDSAEINKFNALADEWWNKNGPLKTLHDINPVRMAFINEHCQLSEKRILDVGCGAGILTEALAEQAADVNAIDMSPAAIEAAKQHAKRGNLAINYQLSSIEAFSSSAPAAFDVITCLEMLEHVPDPGSIIKHCCQLLKPGGKLFLSTLNRTLKAYAFAILGAEYVLKILPKQTHDYAKFIKPAELAQLLRNNGLTVRSLRGMHYNPLSRKASLIDDVAVNYLLCAEKP